MDTEFEAKYYPINKNIYREKLKSVGAEIIIPERKMKRVIIDGVIHKQLGCDYIRVRDEGSLIRLSAKIHAKQGGKLKDQKEIDVEISDFDKMLEIIKLMGFTLDRYQENLRETWKLDNATIEIDTWPGLEAYTEIESTSEESVKKVFKKLNLDWKKKRITAVAEIFAEVYNLGIKDTLKKMSYITFENNPFDKLTAGI